MPTSNRSRSSSTRLARQASELAIAVPQVMAHRLTRMALGGAVPNARDQAEFDLMSAEKTAAFTQSWNAMATRAAKAQQDMAWSMARSMFAPWLGTAPSLATTMREMESAAWSVASAGMKPVHRTATANARRLARTPLI